MVFLWQARRDSDGSVKIKIYVKTRRIIAALEFIDEVGESKQSRFIADRNVKSFDVTQLILRPDIREEHWDIGPTSKVGDLKGALTWGSLKENSLRRS